MKFYKQAFIIVYFFTPSFLSSMERFSIECKDGSLRLEEKTYKFIQNFIRYRVGNLPISKKDLLSFLTSFHSHVQTFKIAQVIEALSAAHILNIDSKKFYLINWLIEYYKKTPFVRHTNKTGLSIQKLGIELTTQILKKFFDTHTHHEIDEKSSQLLADALEKAEYCWPWISMDGNVQVMVLYPNKDYATIILQKGRVSTKESFTYVNVDSLKDNQLLNDCTNKLFQDYASFKKSNKISLPISHSDFKDVITVDYIDPSKNSDFLKESLNVYYKLDVVEKMKELVGCLEKMINDKNYQAFSFSKKDFISDSLFRWILLKLIKHQMAKNSTEESQHNYDIVLKSLTRAYQISFFGGNGILRVYVNNKSFMF